MFWTKKRRIERRIDAQAATFSLSDFWNTMSEDETVRYRDWLLSNPKHRDSYLDYIGMQRSLGQLFTEPNARSRVRIILGAADKAPWRVPRTVKVGLPLAATASALFAWLGLGLSPEDLDRDTPRQPVIREQTYETDAGHQRMATFQDGTAIHINIRSRLTYTVTDKERRVKLIGGEAFFEVAPDPLRPFYVETPGGVIRVLGTRFNVYVIDGFTRIEVLDGSISVVSSQSEEGKPWSFTLHTDQQLDIGRTGPIGGVIATSPGKTLAWMHGIIPADREPLARFLEDVQRYTNKEVFTTDDPRLRDAVVYGVYATDDISNTLKRLQSSAPLLVTETPRGFIVQFRPEDGDKDTAHTQAPVPLKSLMGPR